MGLYDHANIFTPVVARAVQLATPGGSPARVSGAANGAGGGSADLGSAGTGMDGDGFTIWPLAWGVDAWDDPRAWWFEDVA